MKACREAFSIPPSAERQRHQPRARDVPAPGASPPTLQTTQPLRRKAEPLPTLVPQSPESPDRSPLILPAGYEIGSSSNNSSHSENLTVQQPEANEKSADGSPSGSQPDPSSPPDLNSHPDANDAKSPAGPGADPEAKPKPARRSGRTGTSPKPRPRQQRKPATYAIYNELVQCLPMCTSNADEHSCDTRALHRSTCSMVLPRNRYC
jgi:hypothetical protein